MANNDDRLQNELSLLQSMYPEQVKYDAKASEFSYRDDKAALTLRLPSDYLESAVPEVISASSGRIDLRAPFKQRIHQLETGEEILDSIILSFNELAESTVANSNGDQQASENYEGRGSEFSAGKATIIVWLHHLLNTNKRKQALSPSLPSVSPGSRSLAIRAS